MNILLCPNCEVGDKQSRYGFSRGVQRYRCGYCGRVYVDGDARGYDLSTRARVLSLLGQGHTIREVARIARISTSTVLCWKKWGLSQSERPERPHLLASPLRVSPMHVPPLGVPPIVPRSPGPVGLPPVSNAQMTPDKVMALLEAGGEVSAADLMRE